MRRLWASLLIVGLAACGGTAEDSAAPSTGLRLLGGETSDGFARATEPREFVFPADHGSHPAFRTEWWYFTGNLATSSGRHFGFELTFFRYALAAEPTRAEQPSDWRANQAWMAHFAITDTANRRFFARERFAREALGLAGAQTEPLRIWVKDWSAAGNASSDDVALRLEARDRDMAISLALDSTIPAVAQGDRGLDRKGAAAGNASYYYSMPRLESQGSLTVDGESFEVTGLAWLDREWSTSSLEPGIAGWDWFALHLSDGGSLMFYRLRTATGDASPYSGGTLVDAGGKRTRLGVDDVLLEPRGHWRSDATGVRYPVRWRLRAPTVGIDLELEPYLEGQELDLSVRYWEGAIRGAGRGPAGALTAQGYLELAGYQ